MRWIEEIVYIDCYGRNDTRIVLAQFIEVISLGIPFQFSYFIDLWFHCAVSANIANHENKQGKEGDAPSPALVQVPTLVSPSSSSSSSSDSSVSQVGQPEIASGGNGNHGGLSSSGDHRLQQRLVHHRPSLPGQHTRENSDALDALQERILYQDLAGRKHSVDSGLTAQRRVPTFVRTYREVAWKRVNKNNGKKDLWAPESRVRAPGNLKVDDVVAKAVAEERPAHTEDAFLEEELSADQVALGLGSRSRAGSSPEVIQKSGGSAFVSIVPHHTVSEYVNGQHIKRGRVPIFITAESACPRRFSADDLVSTGQPEAPWIKRGRCLVIKPSNSVRVFGKPFGLAEASQDNPRPTFSLSEDTGGGAEDSQKRRRQDSADYEFSLADDDDEDDEDDDDEDGDEDYDEDEEEYDEDEEEDEKDYVTEDGKDSVFSSEDKDGSSPHLLHSETSNPSVSQSEVSSIPKTPSHSSNSLHRFAMENLTLKNKAVSPDFDAQGENTPGLNKPIPFSPDASSASHFQQPVGKEQSQSAATNDHRPTEPVKKQESGYINGEIHSPSVHSEPAVSAPASLPPQLRRTSLCWTLAQPVGGTLPVNLEGAVPTGVEFVKVDSVDGNAGPLWFEKMVFSPGVKVASTQWSAYSNWFAALADTSQTPQPRRFLVRAEVPSQPAALSQRTVRRASDAYAPYNKNNRNGVKAPHVTTVTTLPSVISRLKEAEAVPSNIETRLGAAHVIADRSETSGDISGNVIPSPKHTANNCSKNQERTNHPIQGGQHTMDVIANTQGQCLPNVESRPPRPSFLNSKPKHSSTPRPANNNYSDSVSSVKAEIEPHKGIRLQNEGSDKRSGGVPPPDTALSNSNDIRVGDNPSKAAVTSKLNKLEPVRKAPRPRGKPGAAIVGGSSPGDDGRRVAGEKTSVWQDILLSLATEKRSVGVANWLLKGR
ncbi:hypothetical protein PoB_001571400 [Plakobranchus ocellatus]|uniref:Uncharacterized protein n=1 Tax=Plakobranchus ocellatus TaxID=259542 RepID=A0AAV3Z482_9GAST|nr:hypothetical protein PoB_001571400 [Plakobranchus ocellatus]